MKTYLEKLTKLAGAPNNSIVKKIGYFYKNDIVTGLAGTFEINDEAYAKDIVVSLEMIEQHYNAISDKQSFIYDCIAQLEQGKKEILKNPYKWWRLFCMIWLLEKIGAIPSDDFNGIIFISEG